MNYHYKSPCSPSADNDHLHSWLLVLLHLGYIGPGKFRDIPPLCRLNDHRVPLNLLLALTHGLLVAA